MPSWSVTLGSRVSKRCLLIWYVTHSTRLLSTVYSYKKEGILTCFPAFSDSKMSRGYIANIFTCYQGFYSFSCKLNVFGIRRPFDGFFLLLAILSHYLSPFRSDSCRGNIAKNWLLREMETIQPRERFSNLTRFM